MAIADTPPDSAFPESTSPSDHRRRLLDAMSHAVARKGYADTTIADLAAEARVSRRTFYELFSDREDCLLAALDEAIHRASRHMLDAYDPQAGWAERIRTAIAGLLSFLDMERGAGWLLIVGSLGAETKALERRRHVLAQIITVIDEGRKEARAGAQPPPLTAEGIVGGVLSVLHARLSEENPKPLLGLAGPLMSIIVLPYLGPAAARRELARTVPAARSVHQPGLADPLRDVEMRLTYRTIRVLASVAAHPGSSNREIGIASGVDDQGQISKLLTRLHKLGLIENTGVGQARGAPNAWTLTPKGQEIEAVIGQQTTPGSEPADAEA